ncbi:MAG: hypothetical protein KME46_22030 [Brasilonema angustatum HA4187-MV1]|nr:hypothetical protein [Brasilonema angustatum HA4187-MV1]
MADYPVMKAKCATCPFRTNESGRHPAPEVVTRIQQTVLTEASQLCHHPRQSGKPENHLCRGARDFQLQIFYRMGFLPAPTDEAWHQKYTEMKNGLSS